MGRVIAVADLHVTNKLVQGRARLPVCMEMMAGIQKLAQINGVKHVFCLGDLVDEKTRPAREVIVALHRFFSTVKNNTRVVWHLLVGNHERPNRGDLTDTILDVFSDVCHVVILDEVLKIEDCSFHLVSWVPEERLIKTYQDHAVLAHQERTKRRILLTHVGLKEGRVSASNIQIPQRVGVSHLHPEMYDLVLLGDYHAHQAVGDNVFYLGAPIPHCYGDTDIMGPWLLDTDALEMDPLVLPTRPPQFNRWTVLADAGLELPGYRPEDYNRIEVAPRLLESVRIRYPEADLRPADDGETDPDLSGSRLSASDVSDPSRLVERYMEYVRVREEDKVRLKGIGTTLLTEATRQ